MKKFILLILLFCCSASFGFAQKIVKIEKPILPNTASTSDSSQISDREWKIVNDYLQEENWQAGSALAARLLNRITADNDKKQIAQLRYIYLYSLAGKVVADSMKGNKVDETAARRELSEAAESLTGKELLMPARQFKSDCHQVLNYICTVKDDDNALRVTATNKEGTAIHSFETVLFDRKIDLKEFIGKNVFLGGTLAKVEFNENDSDLWIMRLFFVKGFARIVVNQ